MAWPLRQPAINPPLLWPAKSTSPEEARAIKDLYSDLHGVSYHVEAWRAALALYQFCKSPPASVDPQLVRQWRFIACHECVMELYHLKECMKSIQSNKIRPCPTLASFIDFPKVKKARKMLDDEFPHIDALRHATAHRGSVSTNPATHAPDGMFGLTGFRERDRFPDRFSAPYNGTYRHLDLTDETLAKLETVASKFVVAFVPAARMLEQLGHAD